MVFGPPVVFGPWICDGFPMDGGAVIERARSRFRRTQWDVVLVTATMLVAAAAFVGWRVSTPAECAWLAPDPAAWNAEGVRPQVSAGCPLAAGQLVTWAESGGDTAHLTLARTGGIVELDTTHHQELLGERLSSASWTLVFVVAQFALCAYAFVRKPEDRSAGAALVFAGGLLGSTFVTMLGLPPSAAFTGLPRWLFLASVEATYTAVWGAGLLLAAVFPTPVARWWTR